MPGLFDNSPGPSNGILGGLTRTLFPGIYRQQVQDQAVQSLKDQGFPDADAQLMVNNPAVYQQYLAQRNLGITQQALTPQVGPNNAAILALHPDIIDKLTQIQKVGPGEQLQAPLNLLSPNTGPNNPQPQGQTMAPQNAGGTDLPNATPGQGGSFGGYQAPMNTQGLMGPEELQPLVDRRLKGDQEVVNEVKSGGISGINPLNNRNFQRLLAQTMQQRGISGQDLAAIDARFPAYKDAVKKNADIGASMQLAQAEASRMLPFVLQAAKNTNPTNFPILNAAKQEYQSQTGDPSATTLASYLNALVNTYARGISTRAQGPTDADKAHIRDVANPYWSQGQFEAGARAILNEFGAAHQALQANQNRIDVQFGFGKNADPNDVASAKAAIAKGAHKEDVIRRFEEGGFNAPKF